MTDIIKRAETVMLTSYDPKLNPPHLIGIIAELVKELKKLHGELQRLRGQ
jgi:hypothetical protein